MGGSEGLSDPGNPLPLRSQLSASAPLSPMTSRVTYTFTSDQAGPQTPSEGEESALGSLAEHLSECVGDTGTPASDLVRETSRKAQEWVFAQRLTWSHEEASEALEEALRSLDLNQGWRGVMATWIDQVRATLTYARERADASGPRSPLAEEMGLWLEMDGALRAPNETLTPLCDAPRTIPARALAPHVLRQMEAGETILMIGWSPELVECSLAAYRAGLAPEVLVPEGRPGLAGRGMIRDAARAGLRARFVLDAALWETVRAADRVWVASESIGSARTITPLGVTGIMEQCANEEIPLELFATTDAYHPNGIGVSAPPGDPDRIWGDRPEGVEVDAQFHESVPTGAFTRWYCEHGAHVPASHPWPTLTPRPEPCVISEDEGNEPVHSTVTETEAGRA